MPNGFLNTVAPLARAAPTGALAAILGAGRSAPSTAATLDTGPAALIGMGFNENSGPAGNSGSLSASSAAATLVGQVTSLRVNGHDWRAELAAPLAARRGNRTITGPVTGTSDGQPVILPSTLELSGDISIVAHEIMVASGTCE